MCLEYWMHFFYSYISKFLYYRYWQLILTDKSRMLVHYELINSINHYDSSKFFKVESNNF